MKISPVALNAYSTNKLQKSSKTSDFQHTSNSITDVKQLNYLYNTLFFTGGKSQSLIETFVELEKFYANNQDTYPLDIREMIIEELTENPDTSKTLIDIHKKKYGQLSDCFNLETVKENYDEFEKTLSAWEVSGRPDSFVERAKNGEVEGFNTADDLSLQLIKLYWAEGLSLNDLKAEFKTDLYYALDKKLKIPLLDSHYAHYLKLSDKDYNERYAKILAEKIKEGRERAIQEREGEPVYIPRGPLSEEHKKHISEGLLKYYATHPEKCIEISERQKEYYEKNPSQRVRMHKAMTYAWHKNSHGTGVLKHLRKYFKKAHVELGNPEDFVFGQKTPEQKKTFKEFWDRNAWAKKEFSLAVSAGWKKLKDEELLEAQKPQLAIEEVKKEEIKPVLRLFPKEMTDKVLKNMDPINNPIFPNAQPELDLSDYEHPDKMSKQNFKKQLMLDEKDNIFLQFYNFTQLCNFCDMHHTQTYIYTLLHAISYKFETNKVPYETLKDKSFFKELRHLLVIYATDATKQDEFKYRSAIECFVSIAKYAKANNHMEIFPYLEELAKKTYELYSKKDESPEALKELHNFVGSDKVK